MMDFGIFEMILDKPILKIEFLFFFLYRYFPWSQMFVEEQRWLWTQQIAKKVGAVLLT